MRQVPPRRSTSGRGLPCHEPFETRLGDSMGRRELQGTPESLLEERFQDSPTARKVRDSKKTGLSLHTKAALPRRSGSLLLMLFCYVSANRSRELRSSDHSWTGSDLHFPSEVKQSVHSPLKIRVETEEPSPATSYEQSRYVAGCTGSRG